MKKIFNPYLKKHLLYFSIINIVCLVLSCKKFVEVAPPVSKIETVTVFSNNQAALSAALGVYANMGLSSLTICSGGSTLYPALSADELTYTSTNTELLSFQHNSIIADNGTGIYGRLWTPAYKNIYYANAVLEGVSKSVTISDTLKNQLKGEMLIVRGLNYFYLTGLFGDVPLELSTDYTANSVMARTPVNKIYDQLTSDLTIAGSLLSGSYPTQLNIRPNKWTAIALLSRVYLYKKDWANAEAQSSAVISSAQYHLENNLNNVFQQGSAETIWQLASDYRNTSEGSTFIPSSSSSRPSYAVNNYLLSAFETGDQRKVAWLKKNTVGGTDYYYPYKYKVRTSSPITEYSVIFRLAEQYLIRAEARAQQNNLDGAKADLNMIRARAGLAGTNAVDQQSLLIAIAAERQIELFCEWGHRFLDLKRSGLADQVLGIRKSPDWQPTDALYPIPLSQIQANPYLGQNPGY